MQHLLVVVNLVAFAAGIVAATLAYQTYRQGRVEYLRHYFHYLLLLNIIVAVYLAAAYLVANVEPVGDAESAEALSALLQAVGITVAAAWLYRLIAVMQGIREREVSHGFRNGWIVGCFILAVGLPAVRFFAKVPSVRESAFLAGYILYLLMLLAAIVVTLHAAIACGSLDDGVRRQAVRSFAGIHLVLLLMAPFVAVLPAPLAWYAVSCGLILAALVPTVYLRLSVLGRREPQLPRPDSAALIERFASRFGVSGRESEIVELVLAGKTNSEIGEILSISSNTVRNHIYNVYRKAEVRNRVELTNLILEQHGSPSGQGSV